MLLSKIPLLKSHAIEPQCGAGNFNILPTTPSSTSCLLHLNQREPAKKIILVIIACHALTSPEHCQEDILVNLYSLSDADLSTLDIEQLVTIKKWEL